MKRNHRPWLSGCAVVLLPTFVCAELEPHHLQEFQNALGVPSSIAKVTSTNMSDASTLPDVLLIQDIHRHPEVQGHIAAIVLYGAHHWNVQDVYLEGAGQNTEILVAAETSKDTARTTLYSGQTTGAEIAKTLDPQSPLMLHGLEDLTLYRQHVAAYHHVEQWRSAALRELDTNHILLNSFDLSRWRISGDEATQLKRLLQLRLKPTDYVTYQQNPFEGIDGSALSEAVRAAEEYYVLADRRSQVFADVLGSHVQDQGPALAIVGGYHTAHMIDRLESLGKSYVVLSPQVTESGHEDLYTRGMEHTISALQLR